jgi:hypothetical protein
MYNFEYTLKKIFRRKAFYANVYIRILMDFTGNH